MCLRVEHRLRHFPCTTKGDPVPEGHAPVMAFGFCSAIALIVYVDRKHLAAYLPSHNSVASLVISRSATFLGHSADSFFANAVIERPSFPDWSLAPPDLHYLPTRRCSPSAPAAACRA